MEQKVFGFELVSCFLPDALFESRGEPTTDTLGAWAGAFSMLHFDQT